MASRRDFRAIAAGFRDALETFGDDQAHPTVQQHVVAGTAQLVADALKRENGNFRPGTFYEACGLTEDGEVRVDANGKVRTK